MMSVAASCSIYVWIGSYKANTELLLVVNDGGGKSGQHENVIVKEVSLSHTYR